MILCFSSDFSNETIGCQLKVFALQLVVTIHRHYHNLCVYLRWVRSCVYQIYCTRLINRSHAEKNINIVVTSVINLSVVKNRYGWYNKSSLKSPWQAFAAVFPRHRSWRSRWSILGLPWASLLLDVAWVDDLGLHCEISSDVEQRAGVFVVTAVIGGGEQRD